MTVYIVNVADEMAAEKQRGGKPHKIGSIVANKLAHRLACNFLKKPGGIPAFEKNEYGKPYIQGFFFNISHAGDYAAVAVCDGEVGVDIEKISGKDCKTLAKRFFTAEEFEWIAEENSDERFFKLWTMKESYIKYVGKGLGIPLDSFSFSAFDDETCIADGKAACRTMRIFGEYFLSVCSENQEELKVYNIPINLLM